MVNVASIPAKKYEPKTVRNNLFALVRADSHYSPYNSVKWFREKIAELNGAKPIGSLTFLGANQKLQTTTIKPGNMFMFIYDAKHKDTLPYYDKFPLAIPWRADSKYFWSLNLHYLPYRWRFMLLDKLMQFTSKRPDGSDYFDFSYQMISSVAKFKEVQPCIKQYLKGQVKSRFLEIPSKDWPTACMLPFETFAKATSQDVWRDSRKTMFG